MIMLSLSLMGQEVIFMIVSYEEIQKLVYELGWWHFIRDQPSVVPLLFLSIFNLLLYTQRWKKLLKHLMNS